MEKEIEIQQDNLKTLINLMQENPTLRVTPMVDSEIIGKSGFSWWLGSFGEAEIDEIWSNDERIYFKSIDEEDLVEKALEGLKYYSPLDDLLDEELVEMAKKEVSNLDWEKVIVVQIDTAC